MNIEDEFKTITGFEGGPYRYQKDCMEYISEGKSIILRAPTGSGKSEAVIVPFLAYMNETLPPQIIYSLPVRVLVEDLAERFKKYASKKRLSVAAHHGKRIETPLFYPPIIVTTIDQTVCAYTCTPLSLPLRHGNIPAGAVSSAFLVFDEVHTFDPVRALQCALILAEHSENLKLPFVFMSATIPDNFIKKLKKKFRQLIEVDVSEEDIPSRKKRNVTISLSPGKLTSAEVKRKYEYSDGKLIVVCNTVSKAQELYEALKGKVDCELILLHSRFLEDDRREKEKRLKKIFGKESKSKENGILISTQAIEAGLDISCETMLTELSPIDSLIQRAGRCARGGGNGHLYVYDVRRPSPYRKELVKETRDNIKRINGEKLDWELEKQLVNNVLGKYTNAWLSMENTAEILSQLSQAGWERNRRLAESAVREVFSCEISIHDNPYSVENPYWLKKMNVSLWVLRKFFNEKQPKMWKLVDNNIISDEFSKNNIVPQRVSCSEEILPNGFYIVHPDYVSYDRCIGLLFKPKGGNWSYIKKEKVEKAKHGYKKEKWVEHSIKTLEAFEDILLDRNRFVIGKFAQAWKLEFEDFVNMLKVTMLLHDLGKLNEKWQKVAGWHKGEEPLAHSENPSLKFPSHAPVTAYALSPVLYKWGRSIGYVFYYALAHHHSVGAQRVPRFRFIDDWKNYVRELGVEEEILREIISSGGGKLAGKFPELAIDKPYRTYTFISRILRLSDRIATGGEDALLRDENWYGNV